MKTFIIFLQFTLAILFVDPGQAMLPDRQAFVFFAVHRDNRVIAVQSNPLYMADDSGTDLFQLNLSEVRDGAFGGGSIVLGFEWENGTFYGDVSSKGRLRAANVPEAYWASNATVYARFVLTDWGDAYVTEWETPIFLRTIEHINFLFLQNGSSIPQTIPGALPSSPLDYNFTGFTWSPTAFGGLAGASLSFQHVDNGRTTDLQVSGSPVSGWAQDEAPFDLTITSESDHHTDISVAEFRGLSWDGLETPTPAAQPSVTLRRLESGGSNLSGYYWIRGQFEGGSAINSSLPPDTDATTILHHL